MALSLEPRSVFGFFEEISRIPRGSGNESAVAAYMVSWASSRNHFVQKDAANNVFIKKAPPREKRIIRPSCCRVIWTWSVKSRRSPRMIF